MSTTNEYRPLTDLVGGLANDLTTLLRKEVQLAKTEMSEKLSETLSGVYVLAAGGILALGALGVLLAAAVSVIAGLFIGGGMDSPNAHALAGLIVGVIVAIAAFVMINRGRAALDASHFKLERTANSLERDAAAVKERL